MNDIFSKLELLLQPKLRGNPNCNLLQTWHKWFAWYPVRVSHASNSKIVWLRWVGRCMSHCNPTGYSLSTVNGYGEELHRIGAK